MFETVGDNPQCQSIRPRQRFIARGPVGKYAGKIDDLSEPAAICLLLKLYFDRLFGHASQPSTIIELLCPSEWQRRLVQLNANDLPQALQVHVLRVQRKPVAPRCDKAVNDAARSKPAPRHGR